MTGFQSSLDATAGWIPVDASTGVAGSSSVMATVSFETAKSVSVLSALSSLTDLSSLAATVLPSASPANLNGTCVGGRQLSSLQAPYSRYPSIA